MSFHPIEYAKLICFKDHAREVLKLAQTESAEDRIENVAKAIQLECKDLKSDAENYETHISLHKSIDFPSTTLIRVLESISDRFTNFLFSASTGNIVTQIPYFLLQLVILLQVL